MTLPTARYKEITPKIAAEMLDKNTKQCRLISKSRVEALARELRANEWLPTSQGIGFDQDDILIDGQHRLSAIIATNITIPSMLVCYGLRPKAKYKIDVGNKRTFKDLTGLPNVVIAAVRVPFRAILSGNGRTGIVKGRRASTTDLTFMKPYLFGELGQLNLKMANICTNSSGILNVGIRAAIALSIMNNTCSEEEGLDIFNKLVDLRKNVKGVFVTKSISKRREIEDTLPLLLQSLIEKIRQGITPIYESLQLS